jgi:hypothetical protein
MRSLPDRGGEGQEAVQYADPDPRGGVPTVLFEVELALEGVVDRLDDLAERFEEAGSRAWRFALGGRA